MGARTVNAPLFVIVHRRDDGRTVTEALYSIHPDTDQFAAHRHAAELQHDANNLYGRPRDTYRVAELRYLDEGN